MQRFLSHGVVNINSRSHRRTSDGMLHEWVRLCHKSACSPPAMGEILFVACNLEDNSNIVFTATRDGDPETGPRVMRRGLRHESIFSPGSLP